MKRALKMKYKAFFIIFEGLSLKQIRIKILERESPTLRQKLSTIPKTCLYSSDRCKYLKSQSFELIVLTQTYLITSIKGAFKL